MADAAIDAGTEKKLPRIDTKSVDAPIAPLVDDPSALKKAYRLRHSPNTRRSIHVADLEDEVAKGWKVVKHGKRSATIQKKKPISVMLEDRFWSLCFSMGYPVMNGQSLKITFERDDGTSGSKQIDVFAKDDDTVIVAECKTREVRGRKSLQKDIHETAYLQRPISNAIRRHFGANFKPKIVWLYVTNNIIWSENDAARASAENIKIVTETQLEYFEAYISHIGTAGRYQFLAEFLQGQEIPGLNGIRVPATRGRLGKDTFYSFTVEAGLLLKIAFVNHHSLNNPEGRPAYQRMVERKRLRDIGTYIRDGGYFPTNILVNFVNKTNFEPLPKDDSAPDGLAFGHLILPNKFKSAWIIDGQHRLYGFTNLPDDFLKRPLFVVAFQQMDTVREADLFVRINSKQKSVPPGLLIALQADLQMGSDDPEEALSAIASFLIRKLSADVTSPLYARFQIPGMPSMDGHTLTIPEVQKGLKRSQLLGRMIKKVRLDGYLSGENDDDTIERARRTINGFLQCVEDAAGPRWESGREGHILTNPGIRAYLMLMAEVLRYLHGLGKIDPYLAKPDVLVGALAEFCAPLFRWLSKADTDDIDARFSRRYGEGGVREYFYHLCDILAEENPSFGSEDYRQYKAQASDERNAQTKLDVEDITKLISTAVIETLKKIYGTGDLPSGERKYWELGIADSEIKKSAYKAQQETKTEKRAPREAYLHVMDFEKIIRQKGNWEHLKPMFDIPLRGENPKGKQYHLDWLKEFNEVRRVASHSSIYRTLQEEDFALRRAAGLPSSALLG